MCPYCVCNMVMGCFSKDTKLSLSHYRCACACVCVCACVWWLISVHLSGLQNVRVSWSGGGVGSVGVSLSVAGVGVSVSAGEERRVRMHVNAENTQCENACVYVGV